ncbi:hypothetical protein [Lederbergia galactosidilytica]|uniref:Photosystem I assembly protein Ycf4 n=1 Tax=Lederbergia galactosidilytica TaxID=217031 RepID=A0A0Q9Y8F2_9BACI|nr:hypothetical protein [Lederbergia galactosidilytica]KRG17085.1 hypothetical protein ACA29_00545 [Lederbergia galactosidilytica]MBP1915166.1 hypothetical protein [Lederbergia galactosidilytica]OAK75475.1 hypothetical protein ABB05_01840 [Lederbergia galactosidilytica]
MNDFGELLYAGKTDNNKNGIVFILLGIISFVGANFIYAKMMLMIIGGVLALIGLYLLLFKRSEKVLIYENMIVLTIKGQELSIPKEQISHIEYQEVKVRRSPVVSYYPILVLNNQSKVLMNKAFNSMINQDFKKVIESYL